MFEIDNSHESLVIWRENCSEFNKIYKIYFYIQVSIESDTNGDPVVTLLDAFGVFNRLTDGVLELITSSPIANDNKYGVWARKHGIQFTLFEPESF